MNENSMLKTKLLAILLIFGINGVLKSQGFDAGSIEFFEAKVRPLLIAHCYECHSDEAAKAENLQGRLRLDNRSGVQQGGESGPVVVPGKPDESMLIKSVRYADKALQMPPDGPLSAEQVAILEKWVAMGAPDPRDGDASIATMKSGINFDEARKLWAFQTPVKHALPSVGNTSLAEATARSLYPCGTRATIITTSTNSDSPRNDSTRDL